MSRFIKDLSRLGSELQDVELGAKYAPYPWQEILPNDHVVGDLPTEAQKIFVLLSVAETVSQHAQMNLRRVAQEENKNVLDPSYDTRRLECHRLAVKVQLLNTVLIAEAVQAFPELIGKPWVFIRRNWEVVWREAPEGVHTAQSSGEPSSSPIPRLN